MRKVRKSYLETEDMTVITVIEKTLQNGMHVKEIE